MHRVIDEQAGLVAGLHQRTLVHDAQGRAHVTQLREDVRRHQRGDALPAQVHQDALEVDAGDGVHATGWLIEDQDAWSRNESLGQHHPLHHAPGQALAERLAVLCHLHLLQAFLDTPFALVTRNAIGRREELQELPHFQLRCHRREVGHIAHLPMHLPGVFREIGAVDEDLAVGGPYQVGKHLQQAGLAGPVGAYQAVNLAGADLQVNVIDRGQFAVVEAHVTGLDAEVSGDFGLLQHSEFLFCLSRFLGVTRSAILLARNHLPTLWCKDSVGACIDPVISSLQSMGQLWRARVYWAWR